MYYVRTKDNDIRTNNEPYRTISFRRRQRICGYCWLAWDQDDWPDILNSYVDFYVVYHYRSSSWLFRRSSNRTGCRIGRNRSGFAKFLEFRAGINTLDPMDIDIQHMSRN